MHNYIKCKKDLDISTEITDKLGIEWENTVFLIDMVDNHTGEFLIKETGQLCHRVTEVEKVPDSEIGESGVIWGGTEYCRIKATHWEDLKYTGNITIKASILGKGVDADVSIKFEVEDGLTISHDADINLIDNTSRKEHDSKIKQCAIIRAKKMSTRRYRVFDIFIIKPLRLVCRGFGWAGSSLQDISWKLERQINKL